MVIGFCGRKKHGKSEAAKYINSKLNIPIYSFAGPLKAIVTEISGLTDCDKGNTDYYTGKVLELKPLKKELAKFRYDPLTVNELDHLKAIEYGTIGDIYRILMQYVGTNIFRSRNTFHWCNKFYQDHKKETNFIVDDIRFKNEFNLIANFKDSKIFKVVRKIDELENDTHSSEIEFEQFNIDNKNIINNSFNNLVDYYSYLDKLFNLG